jgi:hypothetical protein
MKEYHKITTLWKREDQKPHNMIIGEYALPEFELLKDVQWEFTEKVNGTNIRIIWDGYKITFGGKTDNASIPAILVKKLQEMFLGEANEQKFEEVFGKDPACLYGEGFGAKIQKGGGKYNPDGVDFVLFDVRIGEWWLQRHNILDVAKKLDIEVVPIVLTGTLQEASDFVQEGFKSIYGEADSEGVVGKPVVELFNRRGERIVTKLKHKDFVRLSTL